MKTIMAFLACCLLSVSAAAQSVVGDWQGTLHAGPVELRLVLHVTQDDKGQLSATLDSPDQGAKGFRAAAVMVKDGTLKFDVPQISVAYEGRIDAAGSAIRGTWSQAGNSLPLALARAVLAPERKRVVKGSDIDGDWTGAIAGALNVVFHITTYDDGLAATMDVPAQNASGVPVTSITRTGSRLQLEMKQVGGGFTGTIGADAATITGTWSQLGNDAALVLTHAKK